MTDVNDLDAVFVRSMATRGALGGLNQSARMSQKSWMRLERIISSSKRWAWARTKSKWLKPRISSWWSAFPVRGRHPGHKAGIMEIADIFVVNKADRDGTEQLVMDIESMLELDDELGKQKPPIISTIAVKGEGIDALVEKTLQLITTQDRRGGWKEEQIRVELIGMVEKEIVDRIKQIWGKNGGLEKAVKQVVNQEKDPYSIVQELATPLLTFFRRSNGEDHNNTKEKIHGESNKRNDESPRRFHCQYGCFLHTVMGF